MKRSKISSKMILENERMELRLQVLKEMMSAEKARREVDGGIHWECGKPGEVLSASLLDTHPSKRDVTKTITKRDVTKTITKRDVTKPIKVKFLNDKKDAKSDSQKALQCGQCGQRAASLTCMECGENYCQVCYAKMHHKGAMAKHHVKPILNKVRPLPHGADSGADSGADFGASTISHSEVSRRSPELCVEKEITGNSLLDGTYDEEGSAQSFQDALTEWRNGRNVLMESKETSVDSPGKVNVTSGGVQAGEGLILPKKGITFSFPDNNHISYFERLILQRCRESPGRNPLLDSVKGSERQRLSTETIDVSVSSVNKVVEEEKEEEELAVHPGTVSEYNIFYNDEDEGTPLAATDNDNISLLGFTEVMTPTEVLIRDMPATSNAPITFDYNPLNTDRKDSSSKTVPPTAKPHPPIKPVSSSTKAKVKVITQSKPRTTKVCGEKKRRSTKTKKLIQKMPENDEVRSKASTVQQLTEADLVKSVRLAWQECDQESSRTQTLGAFFLHGVDLSGDCRGDNGNAKLLGLNSDTVQPTTFKLGKATWAPDTSTVDDENKHSSKSDHSSRPTFYNRLHIKTGCKDPYYDDGETDSEPENEREEFISSRIGHASELMETGRISRASMSNYRDPWKEEEEEELLEWDQADYDALENLASELRASTANFNRSTMASSLQEEEEEEDSQEEDKEEKHEEENSKKTLDDSFGEDLDMSRIQSNFDLYQRKLLDQDSD